MEESGDSAHREETLPPPLSCYILHCPPQPNAETQLFHPHLDKQPRRLESVLTVPGCICTITDLLFGANIRLLLNLFQSVSSSFDIMDMMQCVWLCI